MSTMARGMIWEVQGENIESRKTVAGCSRTILNIFENFQRGASNAGRKIFESSKNTGVCNSSSRECVENFERKNSVSTFPTRRVFLNSKNTRRSEENKK